MHRIAPPSCLYSATCVVHFLEYKHLASLDLMEFDQKLHRIKDDEQSVLIKEMGMEHEHEFVQKLRAKQSSMSFI